jgi:hypothetical protein
MPLNLKPLKIGSFMWWEAYQIEKFRDRERQRRERQRGRESEKGINTQELLK